jgi:hypothetical protein
MATTAPGSPYVESSDLVANYPAVSEALAERVDTVGVLPFATSTARGTALPSPTEGQYTYLQDTNATEYWDGAAWVAAGVAPGLVHINTTSFSAVSSVSLNDVFTSTYDNYRIVVSSAFSSDQSLRARLRLSGTDASGTTYYYQRVTGSGSTAASTGESSIGHFYFGDCSGNLSAWSIDMFNPAKASETQTLTLNVRGNNSIQTVSGVHTTATAYDGITFFPTSGTMTGTIRVYGYQNS